MGIAWVQLIGIRLQKITEKTSQLNHQLMLQISQRSIIALGIIGRGKVSLSDQIKLCRVVTGEDVKDAMPIHIQQRKTLYKIKPITSSHNWFYFI